MLTFNVMALPIIYTT